MSYCRFSGGDVYLWATVHGGICCQVCKLTGLHPSKFTKGGNILGVEFEPCKRCGGEGCELCMMHGDTMLDTRSEAIEHLLEHREAGHQVPQYAIDRLREERAEIGDTAGLEYEERDR